MNDPRTATKTGNTRAGLNAPQTASEGVRVRLLVAIPVVILLVIAAYGGLIYLMVNWEFSGVAAEAHLDNFAGDWLRTLVGFVIVASVLGYYLAHSITAPIWRMIAITEKVAGGDLMVPERAATSRAGEVGALSQSFDHMIESLNKFVQMRNRFILDSFSGGLLTCDLHGTVTALNSSAEKILGMPADSAIGRSVETLLSSAELRELREVVNEALWKHDPMVSRKLTIYPGGNPKRLSLNVSHMRDESGRVFGVIINFRDQSELERFYEQMNRTEQLAALGTFSAGLAHEIRNPLGAIKGITQLLTEDLKDNPQALEYAGIIIREADRLDDLVREVQEFSQPTTSRSEWCDLNAIVRETVVLARNNPKTALREGVQLIECYADLPATMLDPDTTRQAMLNILVNAIEATPPGGRIEVSTSLADGDPLPLRVRMFNSGSTIAVDHVHRIFEPFFTTKEEGSGLGLSITHQIIRHQGGDITVDATDSSVAFTVKLPLSEGSAD